MRTKLFLIPLLLVALMMTACGEIDSAEEPDAGAGRSTDTIGELIEELLHEVGLANTKFLGLYLGDWINLAVSVLIIFAGYLIGTWLIRRVLRPLTRRTATTFDDKFLEHSAGELRWLAVLLAVYIAWSSPF